MDCYDFIFIYILIYLLINLSFNYSKLVNYSIIKIHNAYCDVSGTIIIKLLCKNMFKLNVFLNDLGIRYCLCILN